MEGDRGLSAPRASPTPWVRALRRRPGRTAIILTLSGFTQADIPALCERVRAGLHGSDADLVICDVGGVDADGAAVDALARLQLTVQRFGHRVRLRHASPELRELLALTGLCDVLALCDDLPLEPRGQPEEGEQPGGIQEEGDPGDSAV